MYNRYVLQPDGSHQKRKIADPEVPKQPDSVLLPDPVMDNEQEEIPAPEKIEPPSKPKQPQIIHQQNNSAGSFLRNLLPKNLDTGDLLIVILLLLMSSDSPQDSNTAFLTLALYLFL